jgi:L-ascorbate metabolism protein UlaG (beta-lactamase superfamily)
MRKGAVLIAAIAIWTVSAVLAAEKQVTIRWYGHAFLLVTSPQGVRIAMDPFGEIGYPMPDVTAEIVTVSHEHSDHNNAGLIKGNPKVLRGLEMGGKHWTVVNHREKDVRIRAFPAYHDKEGGKKRGLNSIFLLEIADLRIAHMSDIGLIPSDQVFDALGRIDLLFVPVGGHFSIDAKEATQIVERLKPPVVIPIHYKTEATASWPIADEKAFLEGKPRVTQVGNQVSVSKENLPRQTEIWVMSYR